MSPLFHVKSPGLTARGRLLWRAGVVLLLGVGVCDQGLSDEISGDVEDQDPTTEPTASWISRGAEWLNGSLEFETFSYFQDSDIDSNDPFVGGKLILDFSGGITDELFYVARPRFQIDNGSRAQSGFNFIETSLDRYYAQFDELFLDYYSSRVRLTVGKQIYSWGVSDTYKPVENLNPYELVDLPTARKMGVYSIGATGFWDEFTVESVLVPWFTPSMLPRENNRWIGSSQTQLNQLRSMLGFTPSIQMDGREIPERNLEHMQGGLRLASSSLVTGWDLALTFVEGRDPIGVLEADLTNPPAVGLTQIFPRFQEYGATASTTFGSVEAHAEVAYRDTVNNDFDDDFIEYVAGLNYTIYQVPKLEQLRIVAEYAGEEVVRSRDSNNAYIDTGHYIRPFKNSFLGSAEFKVNDSWLFTLSSALNLGDADYFLQPKASYQFQNGLKLEGGFDFMAGDPDTFFGRWRQNDRFFLISTYKF